MQDYFLIGVSLKLVVVIPAYNEEKSIAKVIEEIPRGIADTVEIVVIDDGSMDNTVKVAQNAGADRVVVFKYHRGLGHAFRKGLETATDLGADIIVNIDADGQYVGNEISKLIKPIIDDEADITLGSRFKGHIEEMPLNKEIGNTIATKITNFFSGIPVSDAQTGFRAFSRDAALKLNVLGDFTYVQETIIQAVQKGLKIVEVPCTFRKREGKSRLISGVLRYGYSAGFTILRTSRDYMPFKIFMIIGGTIFFFGLIVGLRVLVHFMKMGYVTPYQPSAILTAVLLIIGFQIIVLGLIADMIGNNRRVQEEILYRLKKGK